MRWLGRLEQGNCTPGRPVLRLNILRSKDTDSAAIKLSNAENATNILISY